MPILSSCAALFRDPVQQGKKHVTRQTGISAMHWNKEVLKSLPEIVVVLITVVVVTLVSLLGKVHGAHDLCPKELFELIES